MYCVLQELILTVLTVLLIVGLALGKSKTTQTLATLSDDAAREINRTVPAHIVLCSPNTSEVSSLMYKTLSYLDAPKPLLYFYPSDAEAEEAYMNIKSSDNATSVRVIGIHFDELSAPSSVNYSVRFRAQDVADTNTLFNHERE